MRPVGITLALLNQPLFRRSVNFRISIKSEWEFCVELAEGRRFGESRHIAFAVVNKATGFQESFVQEDVPVLLNISTQPRTDSRGMWFEYARLVVDVGKVSDFFLWCLVV